MKTLTMKFKAGPYGFAYTNVNFARAEAQRKANKNKAPVAVYQVSHGGTKTELQVMNPE